MTARTSGRVVAGFIALVALAGCSETKAGTPQASGDDTSVSATPGSGRATTPSATSPATGTIEPCELLSSADTAALGVGTGKPKTLASGTKTCDWSASGKFGISLLASKKGLSGLNGENVDLPKHKAIKTSSPDDPGSCAVVVGISDTASVIVTSVLNTAGSLDQTCPRAIDVAKIIDPKLP
jgi:hypothetical protein